MFGKKISDYVHFELWILILITVVFAIRLGLSLSGVSNGIDRWVSINIVELLGIVFFSVVVHTSGFGSYKHLFGLLFFQILLAHALIALGIALSIVTKTPNIYTAPEYFGGSDGSNWAHAGIHLVAGATILPVIAWLTGSVILFVTKRVKP